MRVLHLLKTSDGATWALRQMRELVNLGVEVHALMPAGGRLLGQYRDAGVIVHEMQTSLPVRTPHVWPGLFSDVRDRVGRIAPDIIHSHFVATTLTMRLALGKRHPVPRVFQVPGPLHLEHAVVRNAEIQSAGSRDSWIGSCRWTCDRYRRSGISADRVHLSYYGSDLNEITRRPRGRLRKELRLDPETRIVGMVAYMYAPKRYLGQRRGLKGHEDLIDALAMVRDRGQAVVGVFVGGAWEGAAGYEQRVRSYSRQRLGDAGIFLGTRYDIPDLYADFDVAVHPSHSENLGAAAESQLLEVPTIATRVGGFPDIVRPGETGWLVPPGDCSALAESIIAVLEDSPNAAGLANHGRDLAERMLDVRENAREIVEIYTSVLARAATT